MVRIGLHDIAHHIPPLPHNRLQRQPLRVVIPAHFHTGKQAVRGIVEENRVIPNARLAEKRRQLRPDLVMTALIFLFESGQQLHGESDTCHY